MRACFMQDLRESVSQDKNRNRRGEEINARAILLRLNNKLIPKRIRHRKSEIGPPKCIYSYPECVLQYI